jgi:sugar O-acyltransferase (sialic acid O-acetyltransferase NeuD family)
MSMASERLIIVGAGGFGRELLSWAADCCDAGDLPAVAGFIDDDAAVLRGYDIPVDFLGSVSDFQPGAGDQVLLAIGNPKAKQRVAAQLADRGARFATMIHPTAVVSRSARLGEGVILCPLSLVSANARVGRLVTVNVMSSIGHDVMVGDYSTLSAHVDLTGFVSLGEGVMVGSSATVVPKVKVGAGATIGAGSTVYRTIPEGATVYAQPSKLMGKR